PRLGRPPDGSLQTWGCFLHSPPPMRWLTVTVAGSSCRWSVLLGGLMGALGLAHGQTIELAGTPNVSASTDVNRSFALVEVVTDRSEPDPGATPIGEPPMPRPGSAAQVTVVTQEEDRGQRTEDRATEARQSGESATAVPK